MSDLFITILKLCYGREPVREVFADDVCEANSQLTQSVSEALSSESGDVSDLFITILKLCYGREPVREVFADDVCEANSQLTQSVSEALFSKSGCRPQHSFILLAKV